jgi:Mg-chelatase subunit ChlD
MLGLEVDLNKFIVAFIRRLRNDDRIRHKPSLRQGIALMQLLSAKYLRKKSLDIKDLVQTAVNTTYYEDQILSRTIAKDVITTLLNEKIVEFRGPLSISSIKRVIEVNTMMNDYLKNEKIMEKMLKMDIPEMEDLKKLVDLIFNEKKDELNTEDLKLFDRMEKLEEYRPKIDDPEMQIYADNLLQNEEWKQEAQDFLDEHPEKLGEVFKNLNQLGTNTADMQDILENSISKMKEFMDYKNAIEESKMFAKPLPEQLENIPTKDLDAAFRDAKKIDEKFDSSVMKDMFNMLKDKKFNPSIDQLLESFHENKEWDDLFQKKVEKKLKNLSQHEKSEMLQDMLKQRNMSKDANFKEQMNQALKSISNDMLKKMDDLDNFMKHLDDMVENQVPFDEDDAIDTGQILGGEPEDIQNIINRDYDTLNNMIERNLDDFQKYSQILKDLNLNAKQKKDLVSKGISKNLISLLGALAHKDLKIAAQEISQQGHPEDFKNLIQGMTAGDGMNILTQWYETKEELPLDIKPYLKELAKNTLIDIAFHFAKTHFGFIKNGSVKESSDLRYYIDGDPIDKVQIDETLQNLIDLGKGLEFITGSDIICKKDDGQTVKINILIDISGSMDGKKLLSAALASIILLYILNTKDFQIIIFESKTHILKDFDDISEIDEVADKLLSVKSGGGTQVGKSLELLLEALNDLDANESLLSFIFSDFAFYESETELIKYLQKMQKYNLQMNLFSTEKPEKKNLALFMRYLNLNHAEIPSVEDMPALLGRILRDFN